MTRRRYADAFLSLAVAVVVFCSLLVVPCSARAAAAPPCDFLSADFTGADAPVLERLFGAWGFRYYAPDGKWGDQDAYELKLFQRWAKLSPSGLPDMATRKALLAAYQQFAETAITRQKLPLEGRYVGVNAGHQSKADYTKERLSPEKNSPLKQKTSSGTQGRYTRVPEYKVNLAVALKLQARLEALGARVLMVRTTDTVRIGNGDRARMMNAAHVGVMLSLHCDGSTRLSSHGFHTLIPADRGYQHGGVLKQSQSFAKCIQAEAIKASGAFNRGFSTRRDLTSFNWSAVPTCLVEMGFMTYKAEDKLLVTAAYQDKLAKGLANGIQAYFAAGG